MQITAHFDENGRTLQSVIEQFLIEFFLELETE